ncbi:MAG: hypothetical protein WC486_02925 [Candidatus Omnitrophota bacterium]
MADCEKISTCVFFNSTMADKPAIAELYKNKFCRGDNSLCARHMVLMALGKDKVPPNLSPNEWNKANKIISQG